MIINFNIGLLGHVDSGKTTLARALSAVASTAAFDKNPQSRERGITLDLGFSALEVEAPPHLRAENAEVELVQFTFVDCPGHASLIRTIIGGAHIIDCMILVVDALKGMQTQTAECIVIGELLCRKLIVVVNKIDLLEQKIRDSALEKLGKQLKKILTATVFGAGVPIYNIAAFSGLNLQELLDGICTQVYIPKRNYKKPLLLHVDHCFSLKGQGTVCTGTIIQGAIHVNDIVEIPAIKEQRKIKSIQMFRRSVQSASAGDRIGLCVTQFNAKLLERGLIAQPGYLKHIYAACIALRCIPYYKRSIKSKRKFHVTVGHDTVIANVTLFRGSDENNINRKFDENLEYEYIDEIDPKDSAEQVYALLEFETAVLAAEDVILIASKLDMDVHTNCCRLAFWGNMQWFTYSSSYASDSLVHFKVFKHKLKEGLVQRVVSNHEVIVRNLFTRTGNRDAYVNKKVTLSTGEVGVIESTFGQTSKVKINFPEGIKDDTMYMLKTGRMNEVVVKLVFKKYIFNKQIEITQ